MLATDMTLLQAMLITTEDMEFANGPDGFGNICPSSSEFLDNNFLLKYIYNNAIFTTIKLCIWKFLLMKLSQNHLPQKP